MDHMTITAKAATIQGLLAKAASSEFPDEAVAFRDKAFALMENNAHARVVVITDRDELDKQIEGVFTEAARSGDERASGLEA